MDDTQSASAAAHADSMNKKMDNNRMEACYNFLPFFVPSTLLSGKKPALLHLQSWCCYDLLSKALSTAWETYSDSPSQLCHHIDTIAQTAYSGPQ